MGFVGLCLLVGAAGATVAARAVHGWYAALVHPPGMPPNWVFGPVWTALYILIGISGWMVWQRVGAHRVLRLWGWQLAANALWVPAFFGLHRPGAGLFVLLMMLALLALTIEAFRRIRPAAAALLLPYLGWSAYAAYLNAGIWILNRT